MLGRWLSQYNTHYLSLSPRIGSANIITKARHNGQACNPSTRKTEVGGLQALAGANLTESVSSISSERLSFKNSYNKVARNWERHPVSASGLHMCVCTGTWSCAHTCACTHHTYKEVYFSNDMDVLELREIYHNHTAQEKTGVAKLTSDRADFKAKTVVRDKVRHYILIKYQRSPVRHKQSLVIIGIMTKQQKKRKKY